MVSKRDKKGRFVNGVRASAATEFQPGQHWRKPQEFRGRDYLQREYIDKARSAAEIAKDFNVTDGAVLFWLDKHGIKRRNISEARGVKYWGLRGEHNPMYGRFGKDNPNYIDGRTPERQRVYSRTFWKQIVVVVKQRDGNRCVRCGTSEALGTHHLKSWKSCPEARYDLAQIVTMCKSCHNWIHSKRNKKYEYLSSRRHTG